jgi:integrase
MDAYGIREELKDMARRPFEVAKSPAARRYLPTSTDMLGMTRHYIERHEGPNPGGLVYPGEHGGHQQYGHFSKRCWRTLMKEAGLVEQIVVDEEKRLQNLYTPYSLRHFYASMLIAENKDLKTIQERLGHVDAA